MTADLFVSFTKEVRSAMVGFGLMFRPGHFLLSHMLVCMKVAGTYGREVIPHFR